MKVNRIAYLVTRRFYKVPWLFHQIKLAGKENKYTIDERYKKVHDVCHRVNKYAHVNITCTGLENLPKEKRILFLRRYWFLQSVSEMARDYEITPKNMSVKLLRIRKELKEYLKEEGFEI